MILSTNFSFDFLKLDNQRVFLRLLSTNVKQDFENRVVILLTLFNEPSFFIYSMNYVVLILFKSFLLYL